MMDATPPRICALAPEVIGTLRRSSSEVMRYCGVCATSGYCRPFSGFSQKVGAIWRLLDAGIHQTRDVSQRIQQLIGNVAILRARTHDLDVDRRRDAEVEDLTDDV